jgi:uncharacterized protein YdeI (YjbR/CyaY-like superfamily)
MFAEIDPYSGPHFHMSTATQVVQVVCWFMFVVVGAWALFGDRQKYRRRWLVAWAFSCVAFGIAYWYHVRDAEFREEVSRQKTAPSGERAPDGLPPPARPGILRWRDGRGVNRFSCSSRSRGNEAARATVRGAGMEMAYRERWAAEIAEMRRVLAGLGMTEECKWGKPTYTVGGKNVVILQGFKAYFALGFFHGALLKDPQKVLVQLGRVHAGRVMKFASVKDITAQAATIKAYVREAIGVEKAGRRMGPRKTSDFPIPEELTRRFRRDPRFKRAFEALTPGRQRGYLYHFAAAKQSATRAARIEKAMPAIFEGRGYLERR